jgi:hypothetical protein
MKQFLILPLALSMAGCSFGFGLGEKDIAARTDTIPVRAAAPATVGTIPALGGENGDAFDAGQIATLLLPEGAGALVRVKEKHFVNGTRQEIILAPDKGTYGENVIDVHLRTAEAGTRQGNAMTIGPPSEGGIRNEILSRFPDVPMNIVTRPMRNALGPFGVAIGRHPSGSRCVFAWQWVENMSASGSGGGNILKMNALMGRGLATSIRIRLCRNDSTVDGLVAQIEGLQAGSAGALDRIARMNRREFEGQAVAVRGGSGGTQLVRPVSSQSLEAAIARPGRGDGPVETVQRRSPQRVAERKRSAPRQATREEPEKPAPAPAQTAPAPVYAAPPVAAVPANAFGQRYLAPVAGAAPMGYGGASAPASSGGRLALPPQAYRGPGQ